MNPVPDSVAIRSIRPLNKGMILDAHPQTIPDAACLLAQNFIVTEHGMTRRPGALRLSPYPIADIPLEGSTTYPEIDNILALIAYKKQDNTVYTVLVTRRNIFLVNADYSLTPLNTDGVEYDVEVTSLVSVSGIIQTVYGTTDGPPYPDQNAASLTRFTWTNGGVDYEIYGRTATQGGGDELYYLRTDLNQRYNPTASLPIGTVGKALMLDRITTGPLESVDWAIIDDDLIFAFENTVIQFWAAPGTQLAAWPTVGLSMMANTICFFQDRVWLGNVWDAVDGRIRHRIRWSALANHKDFSIATNYLDLPYTTGELLRLIPLGNVLVAYFSDTIYIGTPTNYPLLPLRFERVDMGNVGLVGPRAVTSYLGVHFFIGSDDIYIFTREGPQKIGTAVIRALFAQKTEFLAKSIVTVDIENNCILFSMPVQAGVVPIIWRYNYRSKAWSVDALPHYFIGNSLRSNETTWDGMTAADWDSIPETSWNELTLGSRESFVYVQCGPYLGRWTKTNSVDTYGESIVAQWVTKDFDFEAPDVTKFVTMLNIKFDTYGDALTEDVIYSVEGSVDRGRTWKRLGNLNIPAGHDEGHVNFRLLGSTVRFRLTSESIVPPYEIMEMGLRVRGAGEELDSSLQG